MGEEVRSDKEYPDRELSGGKSHLGVMCGELKEVSSDSHQGVAC